MLEKPKNQEQKITRQVVAGTVAGLLTVGASVGLTNLRDSDPAKAKFHEHVTTITEMPVGPHTVPEPDNTPLPNPDAHTLEQN